LGDFLAAGLAAAAGVGFFTSGAPAGDAVAAAGDTALAGDAADDGAGVGVGEATGTASDCNTELDPLIPGNDNNKPISMKEIAAPIVIFARMF
jgi:hypothetical protein